MPEEQNVTVVSDMSQCSPGDRLTRDYVNGQWQLIDYETVDGVKGVMANALPEHDCGELTLPLNLEGPHKIFLGINYTKTNHVDWSPYGQLQVKLTDDYGYSRVGAEYLGSHTSGMKSKLGISNETFKSIQEPYWKTANLSGQSLSFSQPRYPYNRPEHHCVANLSYVKLVPLTEEEKKTWEAEQPREDTQCLAQLFCTGQLTGHTAGTYTFHPTDEDWFKDEMVPLINSDFKILVFEALRGSYASYKTNIAYLGTEEDEWEDEWLDPLEVFTRMCREHGMKIFISMRQIGIQYPMNRAPIAQAKHFREMRQFAKKDREGLPTTGLSLAYPEVREYWISLFRETLAYGIDGIQLHFNRSAPFCMYEEPVVASFKEKFGEDPRDLPETDSRYVLHCADITTQFVREVREALDEKPGRELAITIYGEPHKYDPVRENFHPIRYNCDVERWIEEKLVDYIMPSPKINLDLIRKWREMGGDRLHIWPDLMPRTQPAEAYAALAQKYYEAGADGFSFWDGERRPPHISEWAAARLLGHRDQLDRIQKEGPSWYRRVPLKMLDGFSAQESYHDG